MTDHQHPLFIVVLQRGWVLVGRRRIEHDGSIVLSPARCVRQWGTTQGLGQLKDGPTAETILDAVHEVQYHPLVEVFRIPVKGEWGLDD